MTKAHQVWKDKQENDGGQGLVDIREWLSESGFADTEGQKAPPGATEKPAASARPATKDYKKLYLELKKKYEQLLAEFEDLKKILE
jgi:hypothetical protein